MPTLSLNASKKTKQTPAGEIPVDWGCVKIKDVITEIKSGVSVNGKDHPARQGNIGVLRVSCVSSCQFKPEENKEIVESDVSRAKQPVQKGTILLSRSNTPQLVGASALIKHSNDKLFLSDKLWQFSGKPETADVAWLASMLSANFVRTKLTAACSGSSKSMMNISQKFFVTLKIPLPPLPEQKKIADILGTWDTALEKLDALIAAKTRRKQALMQQLLTGKKRLPGFSGEWRDVKIGTLFKEVKRPVKWNDNHLYKLVSLRRRSGGFFYRQPLRGKDIKTKVMFTTKAGDFVIAKMQVLHGALAMTPEAFDNAHVSGSYITLVPKNDANFHVSYFNWLSRTPRLYHLALISSYGVMIEKMTFVLKDFLKHEVLIPPTKAEQTAITQVLNTAEAEINLLKKQRTALDQQKRGLMQKLLTGKVRVKA